MISDRMPRVLFSLLGDHSKASSRVRGFWIADELKKQGFEFTLSWKHVRLKLVTLAYQILWHDIVIFQKTYSLHHRRLMGFAKMLGKRTFLDIDDAPSRVNSPTTLDNFAAMCRMADGVFAGSRNLLEYVKQYQSRSYLIPSSIKLEYYQPSEKLANTNGRVCLGWIGNGRHYQRDLIDILVKPLAELAARYSLRFKVVGACGVRELYETFGSIYNLEIDFIDEIDWANPQAVCKSISDFDIGLYPLLPHEFNQYKCAFKALEYMAMSIPVVASAVGSNEDVIEEGKTGYLVNNANLWSRRLSKLIENPSTRVEMGRLGRKTIEKKLNTEHTARYLSEILHLNASEGSRQRST